MSNNLNKKLLLGAGAVLLSLGGAFLAKKKIDFEPQIPNNLDEDTILLFQRDYSPFCVKVKRIMDYKGIPYKCINLPPMISKKFLKKLSGQHLIPVIKHKNTIVHDSTTIAHYLEEIKETPSIFRKDNEELNKEILMLEDWADESFVPVFTKLALIYMMEHPEVIIESKDFNTGVDFLDKNKEKLAPSILKMMAKNYGVTISQKQELKKKARNNLDILAQKVKNKEFIVGDKLSLADITLASHLTVAQNVPYISEDDVYTEIFEWQKNIFKLTERKLAGVVL